MDPYLSLLHTATDPMAAISITLTRATRRPYV